MQWRFLYTFLTVFTVIHLGFSQDIYDKINKLNIKNHRDSAISIIEKYEKYYEEHEKWDSLSRLYLIRGEMAIRAEGYEAAQKYFQRTDSLLNAHYPKGNPFYLYYYHRYSAVLLEMGKIEEAEKNADFLLKAALKIKNNDFFNKAIVDKTVILISLNEYPRADSILKSNLPSIEAEPIDTFSLMRAYSCKQWLDNYYRREAEIMATSKKSLELVKAKYGQSHPNTALAYEALATAYEASGDMSKAFEYLFKSRDIFYAEFLKTGNSDFLSFILISIGLSYKQVGEYELAIQYLLRGLELKSHYSSEENINLLWVYHIITETYIADENLQKAREFNEKSKALIAQSTLDKAYQENSVRFYDAEILYQNGDIEKSLEMSLEIYNYLKQIEDEVTKDRIAVLNLITHNYLKTDMEEEALKWALKHYHATRQYYKKDHSETLLALTNILEAQMHLGDKKAIYAIRDTLLSSRSIDNSSLNMRNSSPDKWMLLFADQWATFLGKEILDNKEKRKEYFLFLKDFEAYYQNHLSIIRDNARIGRDDENLRNVYKPALDYFYKTDPEMYLLTSEKLKAFKTRILLQTQLYKDADAEAPENKIRKILTNIEEEEDMGSFMSIGSAYEDFIKYKDSLKIYNPLLYQKKYGTGYIEKETLKELLGPDELLLEYLKIDSFLYLAIFDGSQTMSRRLNYKEIEKTLDKHLLNRDVKTAKRLYSLLIPDEIVDFNKLLIFPDDKLYYLNFEELISERNAFLIESHRVRYAYSGAVLSFQNRMAEKRSYNKNIVSITPGFSESLRNYQNKVIQSDSLWYFLLRQPFMSVLSTSIGNAWNSISLTDTSATEYYLKNKARGARILHLGTHGIIDDASPLFSKLIFVRGDGEDGFLHTYEIYGEELNADLVVLSACGTGKGKLVSGEGVLSLAHAFTHADCQAVLMTLWEVDEKVTALILENFYEYVLRGEKKSDALRKAKLDYLESAPKELRAPYYWAGLVLIGSDYPVFTKASFNQWLFMLPVVLALLIIWGFYRLRK